MKGTKKQIDIVKSLVDKVELGDDTEKNQSIFTLKTICEFIEEV